MDKIKFLKINYQKKENEKVKKKNEQINIIKDEENDEENKVKKEIKNEEKKGNKKKLNKINNKKHNISILKERKKKLNKPSVKSFNNKLIYNRKSSQFQMNNDPFILPSNKLYEEEINLSDKKIAILIRGHIRESFKNERLYNFLKKLKSLYKVDIYLHTWHKSEARVSWRKLSNYMVDVDETMIKNYLRDIPYEKLIINNDYYINLNGKMEGLVGKMPIVGWKRMWFGINEITEYVNKLNIKYDAVLNFRWDNFECNSSKHIINEESTLFYLEKYLIEDNRNKILFFKNTLFYGIDNAFIGQINQLFLLVNKFHSKLDEIILRTSKYGNQEFLVYLEANKMF